MDFGSICGGLWVSAFIFIHVGVVHLPVHPTQSCNAKQQGPWAVGVETPHQIPQLHLRANVANMPSILPPAALKRTPSKLKGGGADATPNAFQPCPFMRSAPPRGCFYRSPVGHLWVPSSSQRPFNATACSPSCRSPRLQKGPGKCRAPTATSPVFWLSQITGPFMHVRGTSGHRQAHPNPSVPLWACALPPWSPLGRWPRNAT